MSVLQWLCEYLLCFFLLPSCQECNASKLPSSEEFMFCSTVFFCFVLFWGGVGGRGGKMRVRNREGKKQGKGRRVRQSRGRSRSSAPARGCGHAVPSCPSCMQEPSRLEAAFPSPPLPVPPGVLGSHTPSAIGPGAFRFTGRFHASPQPYGAPARGAGPQTHPAVGTERPRGSASPSSAPQPTLSPTPRAAAPRCPHTPPTGTR